MFGMGAPEVIVLVGMVVGVPAIILATLWAAGVFRNKPR